MESEQPFTVSAFEHYIAGFFADRRRLCRWLGNMETRAFEDRLNQLRIDRPIYITGMARSGSTMLLECLADHEDVATHQYQDYPLVFIPIWWNWLIDHAARKEIKPIERFHKDRIFITRQSPEAMEEMVWMLFFPMCHEPFETNVIDPASSHPEFERFYKNHIRKILVLRNGLRYLAKANYNITRMEYIKKIFPDAMFIIPVRNPFSQVASLIRQHKHFCKQEKIDPRVLSYMRISGHFEFGLDRRPINTGNTETVKRIYHMWKNRQEARGFALAWKSVYQHVMERLGKNDSLMHSSLIIDYDDLCKEPGTMLKKILIHCQLRIDPVFLRKQVGKIIPPPMDNSKTLTNKELDDIASETGTTYEKIKTLARQQLSRSGLSF